MKKYFRIAAVVAATVASAAANAALTYNAPGPGAPTIGQAAGAVYLNIAGSSAAQSSIFTYIANSVCDGGLSSALLVESTGNGNFYAVSCITSKITGISASTLVTVYYRSEGGSVVGALPIVSGYQPERLNLNACTQDPVALTVTCAVAGTSTSGTTTAANGPFDSWGGAVTQDVVQLGITDVEPGQLTKNDFPSNYHAVPWLTSTTTLTTISSATAQAGLVTLNSSATPILQQVFGIAVNVPSADLNTTPGPGGVTNGGTVNLSRETVGAIFRGKYTDWSTVPDAVTGNPVTSASLPIVVTNREPGSGTRTATNMYFYNYQCGGTTSITAGASSLNYSTGDDLTAANSATGAIAYASIDNLEPNGTKYPSLTMATLGGVTPTNFAAANGTYDFWYEATAVANPAVSSTSSAGTIASFITNNVGILANAPVAADINVIPSLSNIPAFPPFTTAGSSPTQRTSGSVSIYINPYSRGGASCNVPATNL
jgi:ABC-type phosphate transport system substrate-binding protein